MRQRVTVTENLYAKVLPVVARDAANRIANVVPHARVAPRGEAV